MKVLLLSLFLVLMGCATEPKIIFVPQPVEVKVPVIVPPPEPLKINEPFLPIWLLEPENIINKDKIAKYYVKTVLLLQTYSNQLQCSLDAYREEKLCKEVSE